MNRRIFPLLAPLLASLIMASAVWAQEPSDGPVLQEASVRVVQNRAGAEVTERLVVTGGGKGVEHVLARFGGTEVEGLTVEAGGRYLDVVRERGDLVDRVSVSIVGGSGDRFEYETSYSGSAEGGKVPLLVPAAPTAGDAAVVTVDLALPEGRYLRESFPVIESGEGGNLGASMTSFPSFVSYEVGSSPGSLLTASNAYTALALVFTSSGAFSGCCSTIAGPAGERWRMLELGQSFYLFVIYAVVIGLNRRRGTAAGAISSRSAGSPQRWAGTLRTTPSASTPWSPACSSARYSSWRSDSRRGPRRRRPWHPSLGTAAGGARTRQLHNRA